MMTAVDKSQCRPTVQMAIIHNHDQENIRYELQSAKQSVAQRCTLQIYNLSSRFHHKYIHV